MSGARSKRPFSADERSNIVLDEVIGKGSYGEVWLARWKGVRVAAKQIHSIYFDRAYDQEVRDHFIRELRKEWEVLRELDHPNIVKMLTVLFPVNRSPIIVTELLECDLQCYIKKSETVPKVPLIECISLALGIAKGLEYLHSLQPPVVHRDLATKNILMTKQKQPKIADLGVAKVFAAGKDMSATAVPGTPLYAAPETYPVVHTEVKYGPKVDIFSYGAVVLAIIVGHEPTVWPLSPLKDGSKISEAVRRKNDIEQMGHHSLRALVLACLKDSSRARQDAVQIVKQLEALRDQVKSSQDNTGQASSSASATDVERPTTVRSPRHITSCEIPNVDFERVSKQPHYDFAFKTLFIGNSGVGKSCLVHRLIDPACSITYIAHTVGQPVIHFDHILYDTKYVNMTIWDTAGEEAYFSLMPMYFRGVQGIFLVFDVTNELTFKQLNRWIELARTTSGADTNAQILLIGNKVDMADLREVSETRAKGFAALNGFPYVETSASDIDSLMNMYKKMIQMLIHAVDINDIHLRVPELERSTVHLTPVKEKSKCVCKNSS